MFVFFSKRHLWGLNSRGQCPADFESAALTTRPRCLSIDKNIISLYNEKFFLNIKIKSPDTLNQFLVGVVGNISACHADARGSIPRLGVFFWFFVEICIIKSKKTPSRGIEPRASAWQAEMLPTTPTRIIRVRPESNRWPQDLQSHALPLSYAPFWMIESVEKIFIRIFWR